MWCLALSCWRITRRATDLPNFLHRYQTCQTTCRPSFCQPYPHPKLYWFFRLLSIHLNPKAIYVWSTIEFAHLLTPSWSKYRWIIYQNVGEDASNLMISKIIKNFLNKWFISNFRELLFQPINFLNFNMVSLHLKFLTSSLKSQIFSSSLKMFSNIFGIILKPVFWRIQQYIKFATNPTKLSYCSTPQFLCWKRGKTVPSVCRTE